MDSKTFLADLIEIPGTSGYEEQIAKKVSQTFERYCDEVNIDPFFNVYGRKSAGGGPNRPKIMLAAHMDEIGLMVNGIDNDGFITFTTIGGVDQRILLAQEVIVHGKKDLFGVIGAVPPHLQQPDEAKKAVKIKDMTIDVGMTGEKVKELVSVGDIITFKSPLVSMNGSYVNGKSLDDRAGVALMLEVMKELDNLCYSADVYFVATVQEEVGMRGATVSAFNLEPDIGIAIDVTHGSTPDASKDDTLPMTDGPVIDMGPNMHPKLTQHLIDIANEYGLTYQIDVNPNPTGTDARPIQISRNGVPTVLVEIPLRYMHTTVETIDMNSIKDASRILALFISSLKEGWTEWLTY